MTRRTCLQALGGIAAAQTARGQNSLPQESRVDYRKYSACLPDWLRMCAADAYKLRCAALDVAISAEQIRARQTWARNTFWALVGGQPERSPLNIRTTGRLERIGFRLEKLLYESRPGEWIAANLYSPITGSAPFPGILFQMGHSLNGKAYDPYQRCCQGLAQLGFVVLAFDPMGQGERTNYPGPNGRTRLGSADEEHTRPGRQMLLVGDTATRMQVWDAVRSLDVLASHPLVDAKRLGSAGQSGGGTVTMMLAAVDDRIAAAAVCSGNTENVACANFLPPGSTDDAEQNFIGSGPVGFDRWDLLWPFAPKPLLVIASSKDSFGTYSPNYVINGREEQQRLARAYAVLGGEGRLRYTETPLPHGLAYPSRMEVYRWMCHWLGDKKRVVDREPEVAPFTERELWATLSGSVVRDLGSHTPADAVRARAASIPTAFKAVDLAAVLSVDNSYRAARFSVLGNVNVERCAVIAVETPSAQQVYVPAWIYERAGQTTAPVLILLEAAGRNTRGPASNLYQDLAQRFTVVIPDLRGIGDLSPEFSPGDPSYQGAHRSEENYAWSSSIFGKPMLGARVTDLLSITAAVRARYPGANRISIAADEACTVPALCAAYIEPSISQLHLSRPLVSFRSYLETDDYTHPFANIVPGMLRQTDLPMIAAALAPRKITLARTVDAEGEALKESAVRQQYPGSHITVRTDTAWTADTFVYLL